MKRNAKIFWVALVCSALVIGAIVGLVVYFTVFRRSSGAAAAGGQGGNQLLQPELGGPGTTLGGNGGFDHRSHAVPGGPYLIIDYDSDGREQALLDGSGSHSHYYQENPLVTGKIVKFSWFNNATGKKLGDQPKISGQFGMGKTIIGLTVVDNTDDLHTDYTYVEVVSAMNRGAFCYYYEAEEGGEEVPLKDDLNSSPKPVGAAELSGGIALTAKDFKSTRFASQAFAVRCLFEYTVEEAKTVTFNMEFNGLARFSLGGTDIIKGSSTGGALTQSVVFKEKATLPAQVLYYRPNKNTSPKLVVKVGATKFDRAKLIPVITEISPSSSTPVGGGMAKIEGFAFGNNPEVYFGNLKAFVEKDDSTNSTLTVKVPKAPDTKGGDFPVTVRTKAGVSNALPFEYSTQGLAPISFTETELTYNGKPWSIKPITSIAYGPDHYYYMGALNGFVYRFKVNKNLQVSDLCKSKSVGFNRAILSVAFNPKDKDLKLYVASSVLDWKVKFKLSGPFAWANGQIDIMQMQGNCVQKVKTVISGLPVSNHDHGVNGMVFGQDGRLHIQVGGFTNAGHNKEDNKLGGIDENPLSGASVVAPVDAPGFNGTILYDVDDPGTANIVNGDVTVFSPGWRNSFGITIHSNNRLYATDNGASLGFGDKSISCTQDAPLGLSEVADKIGEVKEGSYHGHPNRNRGRKDPRQCVFYSPNAGKTKDFEPPIATVKSSTDGIIEYTSNVLDGQLKHNLLASKFSGGKQASEGAVVRMTLKADGSVEDGPNVLWHSSGLSMVMSPYGDIVMPRVFRGKVLVLRPQWQPRPGIHLNAVTPFRGAPGGGQRVIVTGAAFGDAPVAEFDGKPCTSVQDVADDGTSFTCKVPPGTPGKKVSVVVVSGDQRSEENFGHDYWYTN